MLATLTDGPLVDKKIVLGNTVSDPPVVLEFIAENQERDGHGNVRSIGEIITLIYKFMSLDSEITEDGVLKVCKYSFETYGRHDIS